MKDTSYQNVTQKELKEWGQDKKKEWQENADFWNKIIHEKLDPFRLVVTNKAVLEPIKKINKKKLKILDVGCGEGYLSREIAKLGYQVFGIDISKKLIKGAEDSEKKISLGIKYFVGDFTKTNFPSSFFDVILSHHTINEVAFPEKAFREFRRILKKGGKLICLFLHPCFDFKDRKGSKGPFSLFYFQKIKIRREYYLVSGIKSPAPYFYLHLPLSQWINLLIKAGFLISGVREPHPNLSLLKQNKWWQENFNRPRFILIEAERKF